MSTDLSSRIRDFIKSEAVLVIAAVAAVASMAAFPLTPATLSTYIGYIDMRTIGLLFCLMTVVAGLGRAGLLNAIRDWLMTRVGSARTLAFILINVVFISAMLVTNDVALITFAPLALALFMQATPRATIATVVAITVAANLGSMCTPIGNPQNNFLVSAFSMDLGAFFATVLPVGALSYLCCIALTLLVPTEHLEDVNRGETSPVRPRLLALYHMLFALCIACVGHAISWQLCCAAVAAACLVLDRRVFMSLDASLLVTFICFFVFVGNLKQIGSISSFIGGIMEGREVLVSALASQIISNVPAAIMLSGFTDNVQALLLGTNIGGLGTPIASLASLISLRIYTRMPHAQTGRYLLWFCAINICLLALLLFIAFILF